MLPALVVGGITTAAAAYANAHLRLTSDLRERLRQRLGEANLNRALLTQTAPCFELFKQNALRQRHHQAIWTRESSYTWNDTLNMVCRYAIFFHNQGVSHNDVVAIYLINCPELLFAWLALTAIGAVPAFVNYNLAGDALWRCVDVISPKLILIDEDEGCQTRAASIGARAVSSHIEVLLLDESLRLQISLLEPCLPNSPASPCMSLAIMYTSGSTGLPKAMRVGMQRAYCTASVPFKTFGQRPGPDGDRSYYCIPLYHGTGGLAAMIDLMGGVPIALAPRFSATGFWKDCIDSRSTIALYVGEILRYLVSAPASPIDRKHEIRLVWGNGLRPDVWVRFQERFGVAEIGEFFATTEGMLTLVNHSRNDFSLGAVGHQGWLSRHRSRHDYVAVRVNATTGDHERDSTTGLLRSASLEEGGEILIRISDRSKWPGYVSAQEATAQKFVTDVLEKGDLYYRTGDALRRSSEGLWYFLDRLGDTYRWKGENVSTTEVTEAIGRHPLVVDANVYGVHVPGYEGRAGCVALKLKKVETRSDDWKRSLAKHLRASLPHYAVPIFVRLVDDNATTGNYKPLKGPLQKEGVDPALRGTCVSGGDNDRFLWLPYKSGKFEAFGQDEWRILKRTGARL